MTSYQYLQTMTSVVERGGLYQTGNTRKCFDYNLANN